MKLQEIDMEGQGLKIRERDSKEKIKSFLEVYRKLIIFMTNYPNYP